jgi:F-type H+-transporting ATPase subunit a
MKTLTQMVFSPLEQFAIISLIPINIGNLYLSFTNASLFMFLTISSVLLLCQLVTFKGGYLVPNAWQSFVEMLYDFVLNLVNEQISGPSSVKQRFFPLIFVTFSFVLFCNLIGMIPYSFTVTSHFIITLGLSFSLFIGVTLVGFQTHGLHFFSWATDETPSSLTVAPSRSAGLQQFAELWT